MPYNLFHETRSIEYTKLIQKILRIIFVTAILLMGICILFIDPTAFSEIVFFFGLNFFVSIFSLISQIKLWWAYGKGEYTISFNTTNRILFQALFWSLSILFSLALYHTHKFNLVYSIVFTLIFAPYYFYIQSLK